MAQPGIEPVGSEHFRKEPSRQLVNGYLEHLHMSLQQYCIYLGWISNSTLQRTNTGNWKQIFPKKKIARPQSQFSHSCVCERFTRMYSQHRSAYFAAGNMWPDPGNM